MRIVAKTKHSSLKSHKNIHVKNVEKKKCDIRERISVFLGHKKTIKIQLRNAIENRLKKLNQKNARKIYVLILNLGGISRDKGVFSINE